MAQFWTDFSEYPTGAPADWTKWWNTGDFTATVESSGIPSGGGSKALKVARGGTTNRAAFTWDDVGNQSGNVEVLVKFQSNDSGSNNAARAVSIYTGGTTGDEDAWYVATNTSRFYITEYDGGAANSLAHMGNNTAPSSNTWYWSRFGYSGTTLRMRLWKDGDSEPGTWNASTTSSALTGGYVGLQTALANETLWIDQFSVGTGGDSAPTTKPNATPTISGASTTYASGRTATGPNTTWGVTFTPSDTDSGDQGSNALSYELRTAASGGGSLLDSGTCTHNTQKTVTSLAHSLLSSQGNNTVYLRVSDGDAWSADTSLTVRRDSVSPSASGISHSPDPVAIDKQYTVTFTPSDATSTGAGELSYEIRTAASGGGTQLTTGTATSGSPKTTGTITDTPPNLITNGTFETNTSGWVGRSGSETLARDTTKAATGSASLKITPVAVSNGTYAAYSGSASTSYTHRHRVWVPTDCTVRLYAWDNVAGFELLDTAIGNDGWQTLEGEVTTGAGSSSYRTYSIIESATLAPWWIDDVMVRPTAETGLVHGSNTRYLRITDAAANVYETSFTVDAELDIDLSTRIVTRFYTPLDVSTKIVTRFVTTLDVPLRIVTIVRPSTSRIERRLSGNAGSIGYRVRFEARTKQNAYLRTITDGIIRGSIPIQVNNDRAIKRTATFQIDPSRIELNPLSECVAAYWQVLIDGDVWQEWPMGLFHVDQPKEDITRGGTGWAMNGFDVTWYLAADAPGTSYTIPSGTNYMDHAASILTDRGLRHALPVSSATTSKDIVYPPEGTTWQAIVNDCLQGAGFYTGWARVRDAAITTRDPGDITTRTPDAIYDMLGFIQDQPLRIDPSMERFANRVVVTSTSASGTSLAAVAVNDDPASPVSTVNLDWTKTKVITADSVTSQTVLDERAARELREGGSQYTRLSLETFIDPRRDAFEMLELVHDNIKIAGKWYVRNFTIDIGDSQSMKWALSRVEAIR